jgi:NAD(P)-dependent dehydrogenase (short-subunit alcohol dehydrogenase family)
VNRVIPVAVVTGANRGIGLELCRQLAGIGFTVVLGARDLVKGTAAARSISGGRPVADGAASVLWGVTLPDDGPTGGFFRDGRALPW